MQTYLFRKLQTVMPRTTLLTLYKLSMRTLLDYADVIYHQPCNIFFSKKN